MCSDGGTAKVRDDGFRVKLSLSKFFVDERARVALWVGGERRADTISHLETRVRKLFGLSGSFCLVTKDHLLLPSTEPLRILSPEDELTVLPIETDFAFNREEDQTKKKKRKKQKEAPSQDASASPAPSVAASVDDDEKPRTSDKENVPAVNSVTSTPVASKKKKAFDVLVSAIDGVKKIYAESSANETLEPPMEMDGAKPKTVSEGRITKRKRVRIRKGKKGSTSAVAALSDGESGPSHRGNGLILLGGKVNTHMRFPASETLPVTVLRNISQNVDEKPRVIRPLGSKRSSDDDDDDTDSDDDASADEPVPITHDLNTLLASIDKFPISNALPEKDDVILFKMLKMDAQYNPVVSGPILGKVCTVSPEISLIKFFILEGHSECTVPNGKFELEEEPATNVDTIDIIWNQLIEPRKIFK